MKRPDPALNPERWLQSMIENPPEGSVEVDITPALAKIMLEHNTRNRPVSRPRMLVYADAIRRKAWLLTGEPIIFAQDGVLNNGQQRLRACIEADMPFTTDVRFGIRKDAFRVTDTGKRRSPGDILGIAGEQKCTVLASALTYLFRWEDGTLKTSTNKAPTRWRTEPDQLLGLLRRQPAIRQSVDAAVASYGHSRGFSPSVLAFCHFVLSRVDSHATDSFFEGFSTGLGLTSKESPIYVLQARMNRYRDNKQERLTARDQIGMVFKAWNAWRSNKQIRQIGFLVGEKMPIPDDFTQEEKPTAAEIAADRAARQPRARRAFKHTPRGRVEAVEEAETRTAKAEKRVARARKNGNGNGAEVGLRPGYGE